MKASTIKTKLLEISREQQIPYDRALMLFLLERGVARLAIDSTLATHIVFKGGYVAVRAYGSQRYTTDIDASITGFGQTDAISAAKESLSQDLDDGVWFHFQSIAPIQGQTKYGGTRLVYRAGIGQPPEELSKARLIHIDLGIGDKIIPSPIDVKLEQMVGAGSISWKVYPVETIIAEKLHCLVVLGAASSRSKDIFDILYFLPRASPQTLRRSLKATFDFRGDELPQSISDHLKDIDLTLLSRGWGSAVGYLKNTAKFHEAFEQMISFLKGMGI